jgi:hypothetical protein
LVLTQKLQERAANADALATEEEIILAKSLEAVSDPAKIRLPSKAFSAVMLPFAVGSSAELASRTT